MGISAMSSHIKVLVFVPLLLTSVAGGNLSGTCDDIVKNENCDGRYGVIVWYDDVVDGADCQYRCNQLEEAEFFSFYNEEVDTNWFIGYCACQTECVSPSSDGCSLCIAKRENEEDTDEKELAFCNCMRGTMEPSVESCNK
eukprot:TRINITY_DN11057_c0_g1_i1.p1 TRINITY_DN11057_c0_g1~~TRINITY_DN11057_c0_g1_i1.p1  ORF type:complete len:149 (-),score=32.13 TRINITY_DN11057_c0_g1_i1:61-483(-)